MLAGGDRARPWAAATTALALVALAPELARAQPAWDTPTSRGFDSPARSGGEYEMGFWTAGRDESRLASVSGIGRVGIVLDRVFELRLVAGWAFGDLDQTLLGVDGDAGSAANPMLSGFAVLGEERWRLRLGAGLVFPAAPGTPGARQAAFLAASTRGLSELWLWTSNRLSIVPTLELSAVPINLLYLEAALRPALILPIDTDSPVTPLDAEMGRSEVDFAVEASAAIGVRHDNVLGGLRVRGLFNPTFQAEEVQSSLELFLRGTGRIPGTSVELFGEARLDTNLDPGLGFGFSELGRWGLFFAIGASAGGREIPAGRYGVANVEIVGAEQLDAQSITACLGTRERSAFSIDIGLRGTPECNEPPFDADHLLLEMWHWPWTEWPLFDESVLERDVERIERWYRARGFYDARVTATEVDPPEATRVDDPEHACPSGEECTVRVRFTVEEGEPLTVERIALRGIDEAWDVCDQADPPEMCGSPCTPEDDRCGDALVCGTANRCVSHVPLPDGTREALRATLPFRRGERFDETLYEGTKQRMLRVLADRGYARAQVGGSVKVNRERREAFIIFAVRAGPPSVIGRVCVRGYGELPAPPLLHVAGLDAGQGFSRAGLEDAQRALYALGVFSAVEVAPHEQEVEEEPEEEPAGSPRPEPDDGAPPETEAQAEEVGHDQDSDVAPTTLDPARPRVSAGRVDVSLGDETPVCNAGPAAIDRGSAAVDIDIRVTPGRLERSGIGGGFQAGQVVTFGSVQGLDANQDAAQWDFHLSAAYEHRNLFDNLIRMRLEVRPRLIFEMPFLNFTPAQDPPLGIQTTANFRWPAFIEGRTNLLLQIRHDLGPMPFTNFFRSELDGLVGLERPFFDGRLYMGAFIHANWFVPTDRQPTRPTDQLPETRALWLEEAIRVDLRDDPRNPTAGAYFAVTSHQSAQPLSSWDMIRWTAEARGYIPLFLGIVLAMRFEMAGMHILGFGDELDPDNVYQYSDLGPPALHLRGGGASSNRGFLPGLLGDATQIYVTLPRSDEEIARSVPVRQRAVRISGGTRLWEASLEFRIPITTSLGVVLFADAGDVARPSIGSNEEAQFRFDHPQFAFGFGLRYRTIIGPLRLDIALRPDDLQVLAEDGRLPPTCTNSRASGCNPRNALDFGFARIPGAYHLTIGESF